MMFIAPPATFKALMCTSQTMAKYTVLPTSQCSCVPHDSSTFQMSAYITTYLLLTLIANMNLQNTAIASMYMYGSGKKKVPVPFV